MPAPAPTPTTELRLRSCKICGDWYREEDITTPAFLNGVLELICHSCADNFSPDKADIGLILEDVLLPALDEP